MTNAPRLARIFVSRKPCHKCGLPLAFFKKNDKWYPCNPDGSSHFDLCKETSRAGKGIEVRVGARIVGEHYQPLACEGTCPALPWDECPECEHWLAYQEQQIRAAADTLTGAFPRF